MGIIQEKSFLKFNRKTNKFEKVTPPPREYKQDNRGGKLKINKRKYESNN